VTERLLDGRELAGVLVEPGGEMMAQVMGGEVLAAGAGEVFFHQVLDADYAQPLAALGEKKRLVGGV
jgi:hypothetical protein